MIELEFLVMLISIGAALFYWWKFNEVLGANHDLFSFIALLVESNNALFLELPEDKRSKFRAMKPGDAPF